MLKNYIGQTGRIIKHRIADHRGYITNQVLARATGAHFNLTVKLVACFNCHTTPTISAFALSNLYIFVSKAVVFPKYQYYLQSHFNPTFLALVLGIFLNFSFLWVL